MTASATAVGAGPAALPTWLTPVLALVGVIATGVVTITVARMVNPWDKRARQSILHERDLIEKMHQGPHRDLVIANAERKLVSYVARISLPPDLRSRFELWVLLTCYGLLLLLGLLVNLVFFPTIVTVLPALVFVGVPLSLIGWFKISRLEKKMRQFREDNDLLTAQDVADDQQKSTRWWRRRRTRQPAPPPLSPTPRDPETD
ncbi:hypothetical protein OG218_00805 [Kineococcus sp. NBC_00420]|uniref:hypothetical protein n=1 Tax=Kineococcus sp. NBC_00420 TaxID=2903564 RepID=UPI002E20D0EA